jgi:futalosine hydrolase
VSRILIVTATAIEVAPLVAALDRVGPRGPRINTYRLGSHDIDVLTTGIGMVATAAWCSRALAQARYDIALNVGVCGSFDSGLELGRVVHVVSDRIAELGAEDGDAFLTFDAMELPVEAACVNSAPPASRTIAALPAVRGITVNTAHGNERTIAAVVSRFAPQVESMEGAAFMYACAIPGVLFAQVRAVSNVVARRDRASWKMDEAIAALGQTMLGIIADL